MSLKKVLFVCVGNACRSQMAEGFARKYGADVMTVQSAGLSPASMIPPLTRQVMLEKNISLEDHFPKAIVEVPQPFDLVVNMSGYPLPKTGAAAVEAWTIKDPIGESEAFYRSVRDEIEDRVMRLVLTMRVGPKRPNPSRR